MWLIPGKTKIRLEIFKNVGVVDVLLSFLTLAALALVVCSDFPHRWIIAGVILFFAVLLIVRVDDEPNYLLVMRMLNHLALRKHFAKEAARGAHSMEELSAFTDIGDGRIRFGSDYSGAVLEITPVNFRLFTRHRRNATIMSGLGSVLRSLNLNYGANIVKIDRPVHFADHVAKEENKLEELRLAYETGQMSEAEFKSRAEIVYERIDELETMDSENKVVIPFYYLVLFDSDVRQLENTVYLAQQSMSANDIISERLDDKGLALFLKYSNTSLVDESELEVLEADQYARWAMPERVDFRVRTTEVDHIVTHTMRALEYPLMANDAWLASVMSVPGTKVVLKCSPMDMEKAIRNIDRSLIELESQLNSVGVQSKAIDLNTHIESLSQLLVTLKGDNEVLLNTNVYVTAYDVITSEKQKKIEERSNTVLPRITNMKRTVRRAFSEQGLKMRGLDFQQFQMYVGSQISGYDPYRKAGRSIPSNSVAACYPWVFSTISDENGVKLGSSDGVPVFMDFFKRDSERVNSNMVIVGKSGSGKSYATKDILANLAADNAKIFILDPENEYSELASNLHGKFINVGNAQYGRLNPFHVMTALDDDEEGMDTVSGSFATHLQFLEEFFTQIMPECDREALEYLNVIIERMYLEKGINAETNLSRLKPEDYPIFDDLYDSILKEFQQSDNQYTRTKLRTLINYVSKFAAGGRNANIWNGPSTITTEENLTVFNFQSLLANRNASIANAQMLMVLKYLDNEIIKNRDYNLRYRVNRKVAVVIDEAHVFIDTKFPIALDFMFQLAKRIRKYNGMQIVITQNIKDFVGSEEIARKSTAIINASQYSLVFSLAPNDLGDLCTLYEKAGGINEVEQEVISTAPRGQAFAILGPLQRTTFRVEVPDQVVRLFSEKGVEGRNFSGEEGDILWEGFLGSSPDRRLENMIGRYGESEEDSGSGSGSQVHFAELSEDEALLWEEEKAREASKKAEAKEDKSNTSAYSADESESGKTKKDADDLLSQALQMLAANNIELRIQKAIAEEMSKQNAALEAMERAETDRTAALTAAAAKAAAEAVAAAGTMAHANANAPAAAAETADESGAGYDAHDDDRSGARIDTYDDDRSDARIDTYDDDRSDARVDAYDDDRSDARIDAPAEFAGSEAASGNGSGFGEDELTDDLLSQIIDSVSSAPDASASADDEMDFLKLLDDSVSSMESISAIEQMELYDEEVTDITLEDLAQYLQKH